MVIGKIGPISEMGGIDSRESILIWVLLLLTPDFDLFWVENIPKVFTSLSPICYIVYVQLCNKLQWGKLSHFDRMDSRWDFIWIFIWINFAFFARGSARERFEVAGQWILNQNLWICQNSDSDERERWILWHVPVCLNVWRWKMWPPLSIADSSRHNTCVCGLVISSRARTACHRHYPPPPTLSSPQETILTMCVACAKCARFLFPEIGPILNTTPNLRTKQTDIRFWIIPSCKLWDSKEVYEKYTSEQVNGLTTMAEHVPNQAACKAFTARDGAAPIVGLFIEGLIGLQAKLILLSLVHVLHFVKIIC